MFAPFRGPTGFAMCMGFPFGFEKSLPCGAARVAQPDPGEMEILVEQHAPALPGMPLQPGIENGLTPANESGGGGRIACGVSKSGTVAYLDRRAVEKVSPRYFGHVNLQ